MADDKTGIIPAGMGGPQDIEKAVGAAMQLQLPYVKVTEAAQAVGVDEATVFRWKRTQWWAAVQLEAFRRGRSTEVIEAAIDGLIRSLRAGNGALCVTVLKAYGLLSADVGESSGNGGGASGLTINMVIAGRKEDPETIEVEVVEPGEAD